MAGSGGGLAYWRPTGGGSRGSYFGRVPGVLVDEVGTTRFTSRVHTAPTWV